MLSPSANFRSEKISQRTGSPSGPFSLHSGMDPSRITMGPGKRRRWCAAARGQRLEHPRDNVRCYPVEVTHSIPILGGHARAGRAITDIFHSAASRRCPDTASHDLGWVRYGTVWPRAATLRRRSGLARRKRKWNQRRYCRFHRHLPLRRPGRGCRTAERERAVTAYASIPSVRDLSGQRIWIEDIYPLVEGGRYPVKRIAREPVEVWADVFRDGHAVLAADLLWRSETAQRWSRTPMRLHNNDRWSASFVPARVGRYLYAIEAWADAFATWRRDLITKRDSGLDVTVEMQEGMLLLTS